MQRHYKQALLTGCFLVICLLGVSQTQPVNQPEKYIFYEIVDVDSMAAGMLYHNAAKWLRQNSTTLHVADSLGGVLNASNEFSVFKESGVLKKISGKVTYNMVIEVKDNRYRYHFSDFVFHYYGPDRYHAMGPTGKKKKLEDPKAAGWQKLWDAHRTKTTEKIQQDIAVLKVKIKERQVQQPSTPEPKKEVKWD
jgi:hypothetical protein